MSAPHILLFDLYSGGHHLSYLHGLASYWVRNELSGRLEIAVPRSYSQRHASLCSYVEGNQANGLKLTLIDEDADSAAGDAGMIRLLKADRTHGRLVRQYVSQVRPDQCVLMYMDHVQLSLATDLRFDFDIQLSGIYFRPSFHYSEFESEPPPLAERASRFRKQMILRQALKNPHLTRVFSLDAFAVPHIRSLSRHVNSIHLPDPISLTRTGRPAHSHREQWGVDSDRLVALFFGVVDSRKGILKVLDALHLISTDLQDRLCLVIAGPIDESEREAIVAKIFQARDRTRVQIITDSRFIPGSEVQDLFTAADLSLITYQRHIGSSNVLIRSAAAGVPVLGSNYGLVGALIRQNRLGADADSTSPQAISEQLETFLRTGVMPGFDVTRAASLAAANTEERYAETLLNALLEE